ncbi:metal dependent phosphohydrolase [Ammonifex degensii KC4]|uniref:Metal dependent phosphohydrolase n=1 Tax=Ammonifex degensii (strain DSM 10501 / KC4) TaxID=429009 RepID=C9R7V4_AMMDK|nr:HD domain-containing protein [Ammonifex degensii]ACX52383.1 metal dependent phosphohydrolase [Ammonifex degensii KC4]
MQRREGKVITLQDVKRNPVVETFIRKGNQFLGEMGYTEHSFRHVNLVATIARNILERLNYPPREAELAAIAGYLHDIGNVVSRNDHGISGALIAYRILSDMGMPPEELAIVISAIANHEEEYGQPVNNVAAALILADKSDVHRSRVRNPDPATFDIHDRVNYAVEHSFLWVNEEKRIITLELTIDIQICPVMEYFEIFLSRMALCRRAAKFLKADFELMINGAKLL